MRILSMAALVALCLLSGRAAADDLKTVLEKAVKAHGGEENLAKYKAAKVKAKGTIDLMGAEAEFSFEASSQLPDQFRNDVKLNVGGQELLIIQVYNGKKGWVSAAMQGTMELEGDALKNLRDEAFSNYVESILPLLKDKKLELKLVGEEKVDDKPAVGVKVSMKDRKDITLFFDKESGLLVKLRRRSQDFAMQEVDQETFYRNYKDVNGVKQAMKQLVKQDDKKFMEAEITEVKLLEKLDASTFDKP